MDTILLDLSATGVCTMMMIGNYDGMRDSINYTKEILIGRYCVNSQLYRLFKKCLVVRNSPIEFLHIMFETYPEKKEYMLHGLKLTLEINGMYGQFSILATCAQLGYKDHVQYLIEQGANVDF